MTRNLLLAGLWLGLGLVTFSAQAADLSFAKRDCVRIMQQYEKDPESVAPHLVATCREMLAEMEGASAPAVPDIKPSAGGNPDELVVSAPGDGPAGAAMPAPAADPCSGVNAANSVQCWGPWATLAPAAGPRQPPVTLAVLDDPDTRPELADEYEPNLEGDDTPPPELPLGSCAPGAPCGFATVVAGTGSNAPAEDTRFARFDMETDGSAFTVDGGNPGEVASVGGMSAAYTDRDDAYANMRSTGSDGDEQSRIIARVLRGADGRITQAADIWAHGNRATGEAESGFFAWGDSAIAQADLDVLNGGGATLSFAGPMSVDNATVAQMTLQFGTDPSWTGNWDNPGYSFDAGGPVSGADLVSDPAQFSANVGADSVVQGAILEDRGNHAIAHIIDVDITGIGRVRDVGLLQETGGPVSGVD